MPPPGAPPPPMPPPGAPPPFGPAPPYQQPPPYGPYGQAPPYGQGPPFGQAPYGQAPPFGQLPYGYALVPVDRFGRPLAEWWQRLVAFIIDSLILGIPRIVVISIVVGTSGSTFFSTSLLAGVVATGIAFAAIGVAYFALLNGSERGQTVGQMALGIAVRDEVSGGSIGPSRGALRILVLDPGIATSWITLVGLLAGVWTIVAGLSPLWDDRRRGIHDKVAHTDVIKAR